MARLNYQRRNRVGRRGRLFRRRDFLGTSLDGLAAVALTDLLGRDRLLKASESESPAKNSTPSSRSSHFPARASRVIEIFCAGALSHVDTFDYKPDLIRYDGQPLPGKERLISFQGENGNLTKPLWPFRPRGQSGKMISDLVGEIGSHADQLCFFHSLTTKTNTHGPAENAMSTGFVFDGFPSKGAWINYALGSENQNLPAFIAIEDPRGMPQAGPNNWGAGFLPATFQGTPFSSTKPIKHLNPPDRISGAADLATRRALGVIDRQAAELSPGDSQLMARVASYELAARMQLSVPEVMELDREPLHIKRLYGADSSNRHKRDFARNCLLARRLIERGVRYVQLFNGAYASAGELNWDAHGRLKEQYDRHGAILDQPVAGLLSDLRQRGLMDDPVVVFCTEFGRMPMFQVGTHGRDHNPRGFTAWMAGAGVKAPFSFGATDAFGFQAEQSSLTLHDFHATLLHLLGLDHEKLTFYHNGIQRRLTDVHGTVVKEVLA